MIRSYRKGYLVISALLVVAVAMLYATATLARIKALRNESGWSQSRTQEEAAARSATAKMVAEFNKVGSLQEGVYEGEIHGVPYTAELKVDSEYSKVFHIKAKVGESEYTRVLREEPRSLHLAVARTGAVTDPTLYMQTSIDGDWHVLPSPPEQAGDLKRISAITTNYEGEVYAFRFGKRIHPVIPTPFLSRYDVETGAWTDLPPIPYHFRQSLAEQDGWTLEKYSHQSVLAANSNRLFAVVGPNSLVNRRAPDDVAEFFIYEMGRERWFSVDRPPVDVYDARGQLSSDNDNVSIGQLTASEDQFLMEMSGGDPVSTLFRYKDDRWTRLPPLPTSNQSLGKADSIACGPGGKISALVRDSSGKTSLVRLVDGQWEMAEKPTDHDGIHRIAIDSAGREWVQDMRGAKLYRSMQDGWEEKTMPEGINREVNLGARPDDELFYYQTTTGY